MNHRQTAGRFVLVGAFNTLLDFGILFGLNALGVNKLLANVISTTIAFVFSFFANKKFTFRATGGSIVKEMILFVLVTLSGLWIIQTLFIAFTSPLLADLLHGDQTLGLFAAKLGATALSMIWNYVLYSKVVFRQS